MAKDTYYFSHDYNARNDRKIAALIQKHKSAGYGVFWIACEMMHEEGGNIEFDEITFGAIAKDSNEDSEFVKKIINDCISEFKLFNKEEDMFKSCRVIRNLEKRQEISEKRSKSGKSGANAKQMLSNGEANAQQNQAKERKGKERKEKKEKRGIYFSPETNEVFFDDGTSQKLTEFEMKQISNGRLLPHEIKKDE